MKEDREHSIDVVWLKAGKDCAGLEAKTEEIEGIRILTLRLPLRQLSGSEKHEETMTEGQEKRFGWKKGKREKLKKKMADCIRKHGAEQAAIIAAPTVAVSFGVVDILFEVRKQEFINHMDYIFGYMPGEHILLVIGQTAMQHFSRQELLEVLMMVKNRYRKISICSKKNETLEELTKVLCEEWGVVISLLNETEAGAGYFDTALFFAAYGDKPDFWEVRYKKGYVVMDLVTEQAVCCRRIPKQKSRLKDNRCNIYAGLVYEKDGRELSYELAGNLAYQKPDLYREFDISFVAIYELQCYNKK